MTTLSLRRILPLAVALAILAALAAPLAAEAGRGGPGRTCANINRLRVPGAAMQRATCYSDLTTAGLPQPDPNNPNAPYGTVQSDWNLLNDPRTVNPSGVPGIQIDGYFPDTAPPAPYTPNPFHGWNHDAQFVIRLPDQWNGGLVIAPPPGNRRQYSSDFVISDWVLARGYAYASTDKGNWNVNFFLDGQNPGDAVAEWHDRVRELTKAARRVVRLRYGQQPETVLLFGISNGGYQVRYAIENDPNLYDGGVDWEGTLFTRDGPNLFTYLPTALREYPIYASSASTPEQQAASRQAMIAAGFAVGSEFLWPLHYQVYWDLTQRIYREEFDPEYDGALLGGTPYCASGTPGCDTDYNYASRPDEVKDAVERVSMTGKIRRPLITVQGTLDTLITPATNAAPYAALIEEQGRSRLHRYYLVEGGQHVDGFVPAFGDAVRPVLPCARAAFEALEQWVADDRDDRDRGGHDHDDDYAPPASGTIPRGGDEVNSCNLAQR